MGPKASFPSSPRNVVPMDRHLPHSPLHPQNNTYAHIHLQGLAFQSWILRFLKRIHLFWSRSTLGIHKLSRNLPSIFWDFLWHKAQELATQFMLFLPGAPISLQHRRDERTNWPSINAEQAESMLLSLKNVWEMWQYRKKASGKKRQTKGWPGMLGYVCTRQRQQEVQKMAWEAEIMGMIKEESTSQNADRKRVMKGSDYQSTEKS